MLLLQNAAFLSLFRGDPNKMKNVSIDRMSSDEKAVPALEDVFAEISHDRMAAARQRLRI
jgi:hypothetical protein